jgi:pyrimidine operon attenuation protein/uracil phosphoribosyltransferase
MNAADLKVPELLTQMQRDLRTHLGDRMDNIAVVGIHTGGAWVAEALHQAMGIQHPLGSLNITFYRDDFTRIGLHPQVEPSHLPFEVDGQHLLLVDDVLHTGRTIRAALNEIFDYGRPASISLAVLIDRGGRELPIQADVVGAQVTLESRQHIKLMGPTPLELAISEVNTETKESD